MSDLEIITWKEREVTERILVVLRPDFVNKNLRGIRVWHKKRLNKDGFNYLVIDGKLVAAEENENVLADPVYPQRTTSLVVVVPEAILTAEHIDIIQELADKKNLPIVMGAILPEEMEM